MTTHERELTEPVDLCTPDGLKLNPAARGFSRRPLHRANLFGRFGENKKWDYWAVLAGDLVVSVTIANLDHFGIVDVYWADLVTKETGGHSVLVAGDDLSLPDLPGTAPLEAVHPEMAVRIYDESRATRFSASWNEPDGRASRLDLTVQLPEGHESLNVVIPWSDELFNFTSKHQARPATGVLVVGEERRVIGASEAAWGVLDVGRGRWPSAINWNWGGGAGVCDGHVLGLQVGAKWTEGTGFTENGLFVDGHLSKLGSELVWDYDWSEPMRPWRITDPGGQLDAVLTPRFDKHSQVEVSPELGSEVHQVFGTWAGRLVDDDGRSFQFTDLQGFAEEARQRW